MANSRIRGALLWWRKWAKRDWAIAGVGFTIIVTILTLSFDSSSPSAGNDIDRSRAANEPLDLPTPGAATEDLVDLTLLHHAKERGALCLDGSSPGYHYEKGFGSGSDNWLLHIEGGGWCNTIESCSFRKTTELGSSKHMQRRVPFAGILSRHPSQNPDFFNWNKVKVRYCDGASFASHPESELKKDTELFFRGQLIWEAVMDELLSIGMSNAKQALLTGCSAGGLATLIHCDDFRRLFPENVTVKCLADAGFFLDEKDVLGNYTMRSFYHDVIQLQGVARSLNKNCLARMDSSKCIFPHEIIKDIRTPLFLAQPAYDFWQIQHILVPDAPDLPAVWRKCRLNLEHCNAMQIEILQGFRNSLLEALNGFEQNVEGGLFINSCFIHCQIWMGETWHSATSPRIHNKTIAESVGDWYFNRTRVKLIDCPYPPCNPTCYNRVFI